MCSKSFLPPYNFRIFGEKTCVLEVSLQSASGSRQRVQQRGILVLCKTFFRRNTFVFQGKMTRHSVERPAVWRVGGFQIHPELNTVAVRVFRNAARRPTVAAAGRFFLFLLPSSIPVPALRPFVDAHGVGFASVRWLLLQRRGILLRRVSSLEMGVKFSRYN